MYSAANQFDPLRQAPDLPAGRAAFEMSGGAEATAAIANRHSSWEGKALVPLSAISIACAFFMLGWAAALACSLTVLVSVAFYSLAQDSLACQLKAGKVFESFENYLCFLSDQILTSMQAAVLTLSQKRFHLRDVSLFAIQRVIARLSGLVHVALAPRILPIPVPPR